MSDLLTFTSLRQANEERCYAWHPNGFADWSVERWAMSMAGEAGEVCNAVKKLNRHDDNIQQLSTPGSRDAIIAMIATEIGDTVIYLDLLAAKLGLKLEDCIIDTYNRVSIRENLPQRL